MAAIPEMAITFTVKRGPMTRTLPKTDPDAKLYRKGSGQE